MQRDADTPPMSRERYWKKVRSLTALLLSAWFVSTFCVIFFARELTHISLFGWPLPFYMASQGLLVFYAVIVGVYAYRMRNLDRALKGDDDGNR